MNRPSLGVTLSSLAIQSHHNVEVLVVSACGPLHRQLSTHIGPHPVKLILPNEPLRRSAAANVGLSAATGDYLIFLDDDDTIDETHLSSLACALESTPNTVIAVHTGVRVTGGDAPATAFTKPFNRFELLASNFIPIHAVLFKRFVIDRGLQFDTNFDRYEDWDFWLQVSELGDIQFVPGTSATYHQHTNNSATSFDQPFFSKDFQSIYKKWWPRLTVEFRSNLMHHIWEFHQKNETLENKAREDITLIAKLQQSIPDHHTTIQHLETDLREAQNHISNDRIRIHALKQEIEQGQQEFYILQNHLNLATSSRSWRITAPLRIINAKRTSLIHMVRRVADIASHHGGWLKLAQKSILYIHTNGWRHTLRRLQPGRKNTSSSPEHTYANWITQFDQPLSTLATQNILANISHPLISVVMPTYNSNPVWLNEAVDSLRAQSYPYWELCIADDASTSSATRKTLMDLQNSDPRIHIHFRPVNGHISATSNDALNMVTGPYMALLDHDDLLHPDALLHVAHVLQTQPSAGLVYTDEDKVTADGSTRFAPYFKTDWNRDLFLSHNLISHLGVYKTALVRQVGGFRKGFEGSQDHDLALRVIEQLRPEQIVHIPKVLYHWRSHDASTASSGSAKSYAIEAGVRAIQEHLDRTGAQATATIDTATGSHYRVQYDMPKAVPMVSIVLPSRDAAHLIRTCVQSLLTETEYPNFELVFVDNNTQDSDALRALTDLAQDPRVRVVRDPRPFNYSALCNLGVEHARGEVLALVNNDVEVISKNWLCEMVSIALQPGVGAVGARLWYPNDTLQHGGVILGFGGVANHAHLGLAKGDPGYFGRAMTLQAVSAVTGACLVIKRTVYAAVSGLDDKNLAVAFNDIDFCIRIQQEGFRNIWTPYAEMYHHESATRGSDLTPEKRERFEREVSYMQNRWGDKLVVDPNYNPNLTLTGMVFNLAFPPRAESRIQILTS